MAGPLDPIPNEDVVTQIQLVNDTAAAIELLSGELSGFSGLWDGVLEQKGAVAAAPLLELIQARLDRLEAVQLLIVHRLAARVG